MATDSKSSDPTQTFWAHAGRQVWLVERIAAAAVAAAAACGIIQQRVLGFNVVVHEHVSRYSQKNNDNDNECD